MKVLFIGGTGNISTACSCLALECGVELWHLNRNRSENTIQGIRQITCDIQDEAAAARLLEDHEWDCVVNWIAFKPADVERDIRLFGAKTRQYLFVSSASCYQTPPQSPIITEDTPLDNPLWDYSQNKIACERRLMREYEERGFPVTVVRPSHTYSTVIPICLGGWTEYTAVDRLQKGLPIVVPGDGTSLWVLTHAEDFAKGFFGLLGLEQSIGEAFHITSDELLTWNQIYQQLAAALGVEANIVHVTTDKICRANPKLIGDLKGDKINSVIFDNSKIKRFVPEYQATIPFAEGIKTTLAWFAADSARRHISDASNAFMDRLIAAEQ